jgi:Glycosyl transferase family 11
MKITTQIQGGLGNQLFQYAAGKALSNRLNCELQLDILWFTNDFNGATPREFLLPNLNADLKISERDSTPKVLTQKWRRITQEFLPLNPYVLKDSPYKYNLALNEFTPFLNQDIYLTGYWQSFRYFDSIRNLLIKEFQPAKGLSLHYQSYTEEIQSVPSAMVHVRRGDYVHQEAASKTHGFLGLEYYIKGMNLILSQNLHSHFFVFSDDLTWVKANLPYQEKTTYIENSGERSAPLQELFLMAHCETHLIANSSLSWWGAWLKKNMEGLTICPTQWTLDTKNNFSDLLPEKWLRI